MEDVDWNKSLHKLTEAIKTFQQETESGSSNSIITGWVLVVGEVIAESDGDGSSVQILESSLDQPLFVTLGLLEYAHHKYLSDTAYGAVYYEESEED